MAWRLPGESPFSEPMMALFADTYTYASLVLNELIYK